MDLDFALGVVSLTNVPHVSGPQDVHVVVLGSSLHGKVTLYLLGVRAILTLRRNLYFTSVSHNMLELPLFL